MPLDAHTLEIANGFELQPLPAFSSRLPKFQVVELLHNAVRLRRTSRYIILMAATTAPVTYRSGRGQRSQYVRTSTPGIDEMISGGAVFGHQSDGVIGALNIVAPRIDEESWSPYVDEHLQMPEWVTSKLEA